MFEIMGLSIPHHKNIQMNFIKTNYYDSQKLRVIGDGNGCEITHIKNTNSYHTAVSDFSLDPNLVYVIRCTFNRPYEIGDTQIGLVQEKDMHKSAPN